MDTIILSGKHELDIYMNPQRQNLIRCMQITGVPMTPKQLSVQLGISASSVQHHIKQLVELGLVDLDHTEQIHGITASFYRILSKNIQIGSLADDENRNQRFAIMQTEISRVFSGFSACCLSNPNVGKSLGQYGDMLSGIAHLTPAEAMELYAMVHTYLDAHMDPGKDTEAWEYALIAYPVSEEKHA